MRKGKSLITTIIIFSIIFPSLIINCKDIKTRAFNRAEKVLRLSESRDIIKIDGDDQFITQNGVRNPTAQGTELDPYIISDWEIDGGGPNAICIEIANTRSFFEIRNCTLFNASIGIKITNTTNAEIIESKIFNLKGSDGLDGNPNPLPVHDPNSFGTNGNVSVGIIIEDCLNVNISENSINNIFAGNGGWGGNGTNGSGGNYGGKGGNGGKAYGILLNNSIELTLSKNRVSNIMGGRGGNGGNGSSSNNLEGGWGHHGGNGGLSFGMFFEKSSLISAISNNINSINAGTGANGGNGGYGGSGILGLMGGGSGMGGIGGKSSGLSFMDSRNIVVIMNEIMNITAASGGNGGNGGSGGNGTQWGNSGLHGSLGGAAGSVFSLYLFNSTNVNIEWNKIIGAFAGNGGEGGDAGDGGDGGFGIDDIAGDGGDGGNGGDGGYSYGLYSEISTNIKNNWNIIKNIEEGMHGNGGTRGIGGSATLSGRDGHDGCRGLNGIDYGLLFKDTNNSDNYLNSIFCENNLDNGTNDLWNNSFYGNYWSHYYGDDLNPKDGIGDTPYELDGSANAKDYKPLIYPKYTDEINVKIVEQFFSLEDFNITFSLHNDYSISIEDAIINMEWDGLDVSTDVQNLGGGLYFISLDPIVVYPGEDPILLNMTISVDGYQDKYFETYIAIDPDTLEKKIGPSIPITPPWLVFLMFLSFVVPIVLLFVAVFLFIRKRRAS